MSSIYSGQLLRGYVRDFNLQRQEKFNVNRYNQDIVGSAAQGRREKELRDGLEYHQARMADMQTKLNEMTEKLNNLYRRFMENNTAFRKVTQEPLYHGTSSYLNNLPDVTNNSGLPHVYPAGLNGILPYADPGRIRNYTYNPYFGSKAIDESDQTVVRTSWAEPNTILENAYFENGAFWSTISYLWGWDLDRINATYVTTDTVSDKQVNVTALQPNKPQYPPLRPGDRFPINWNEEPGGTSENFPFVNIGGLRPGGADYSHATDSLSTGGMSQPIFFTASIISGNGAPGNPIQVDDATGFNVGDVITVVKNDASSGTATITAIDTSGTPHLIYTNSPAGSNNSSGTISKITGMSDGSSHVNVVGQNATNWGWEFDGLPLALEVTSVSVQPDGNTVPNGFKVVYDIPPNHPFYEQLRVLNGTEPKIIDAPTELQKIRINNDGFQYTGNIYFPGSNVVPFQVGPLFNTSGGSAVIAQPGESEYSAPGYYTISESPPGSGNFTQLRNGVPANPIATLTLETCLPGVVIDENTMISFNYRLRTQQNAGIFGSTWDDSGPGVPLRFGFDSREWNSDGVDVSGGSGNFTVGMPTTYQTVTNQAGATPILLHSPLAANTSGNDYLVYPGGLAGIPNPDGNFREQIYAEIVTGPTSDSVRVNFYFHGDINRFEVEIADLLITSYDGDLGTWEEGQGKYNPGNMNPIVMIGDTTYNQDDDPSDVVSKYYPNVYQFTQFNDQYNNSFNGYSNRNDILRSPWEFGLLNIGAGSGLSGEMWLDLNGRRLNFDHDVLSTERYWNGAIGGVTGSGFDFLASGVLNAYDFILPVHPADECDPEAIMVVLAGNTGVGGPYNPDNPTNGVRVESVTGFTAGQIVNVAGYGNRTIQALINSPATPETVTTDIVYQQSANPTIYQYRAPFNGMSAADRTDPDNPPNNPPTPPWPLDDNGVSVQPGAVNLVIGGNNYATYNDAAAAFLPPTYPQPVDASHPHYQGPPTNHNDSRYWLSYQQLTIPAQPARQEVYFTVPLPSAPGGGTEITPVFAVAPDPHTAQYADSDPLMAMDYRHILMTQAIMAGDDPFDPALIPLPANSAHFPFAVQLGLLNLDPGRTANPLASDPNNEGFTWATNTNSPSNDFDEFYRYFGFAGQPYNPTVFRTVNGTLFLGLANTDPNTGISNDTTNTIDRVMGADIAFNGPTDMRYTITIPTNDVNVLRKENNLLFNFGSIFERDWGIDIRDPYMEFRVAQDYQTVPRYRVDAGGNIFDKFGTGHYDTQYNMGTADENTPESLAIRQRAQEAVNALYTLFGGATSNGQVSNFDGNYNYADYFQAYDLTAADFAAFINSHNRLSMALDASGNPVPNDDFNLFDYIPDLRDILGALENPDAPIPSRGELYVGSLPTNFYYYREPLDNSQAGPTGGGFNNDRMPSLNFNGRSDNLNGLYNSANTTIVHNPLMPSFTGVTIGFTEQNARLSNQMRTTTFATWEGFTGIGQPPSPGRAPLTNPNSVPPGAPMSINVTNPVNAVGLPNGQYAIMNPATSTLFMDMGSAVNQGGHLLIYEGVNGQSLPHAVPLPLKDLTVFPNPPATSYTFPAYGPGTVSRTGSRYIANFQTEILDGLDGRFDGTIANNATLTALLQSAGAQVSTTNPPSTWTSGIIMHVDDADAFDIEAPRNRVYLGVDQSIEYLVVSKNTTSKPETLFLVPVVPGGVPAQYRPSAAAPTVQRIHTDLQIRQIMGEYTVSVTDTAGNPDANGSVVRLDYNHNGTNIEGLIDAVLISPEVDRTGRLAPGAEVFDNPVGYVQADAQVNLRLVSQDTDGNPVVRKLKSVTVVIESGEQLIPNKIVQTYSTDGPFDINGEWPIAIFEKDRQMNPAAMADMGIFVGLSQGITDASNARNNPPTLVLTSSAGLGLGEEVTINGEKRTIAAIAGNTITLSAPLVQAARYGDVVSLGSPMGDRELTMYLNKSYAMSANAPVRIILEYDEYEVTGYPPIVDLTTPVRTLSENVGFGDANPSASMVVSPANTGTGAAGNLLTVQSAAGFAAGDVINYGGQTATIISIAGNNLRLSDPIGIWDKDTASYIAPTQGTIYRTDYENYLVVGEGRKGGSFDNHFTNELKRIVDNPEYQDLMRYDLLKNVFITATINTPFNDIISSKIMLTWDRRKKYVEIEQTAFTAYYKSGG